jgi:hypothetical protein
MALVRGVLVFALLCVLAVCSVAGEWVPFEADSSGRPGPGEGPATVTVLESGMEHLVLRVDTPGLLWETEERDGELRARLTVPGSGPYGATGEALLPAVREFIELPHGAVPELTVVSADYRRASLSSLGMPGELVPVQPPIEKVPGALEAARFVRSPEYYGRDAFGPGYAASIGDAATMRGHRFAQLEVFPVRYNPARSEIEYASSIVVRIDFVGGDVAGTRGVAARYSNEYADKVAEDMFVNRDAFVYRYDVPLPVGYLIVAFDSLYEEVLPLAEWKEQKGYHTTVVRTSDIPGGNTKENIKAYIQNAYDTWTVPPAFVLLVGDTGLIDYWVGVGTNNPATDLYYVTMDGSEDWVPDIWIGRFSCTAEAQVTNLVDKTVDYETWNLLSGTAWTKKAVFMASNDNYTVTEGTHNYVISTYLDPRGYASDKLYYNKGATTQDVRDAFNDGRALGIYSGHGAVNYWADGPPFYASDVNGLTNTDMLPLVHSYSCVTGEYESACFAETWTNATDKGALVFWGSSVTSYWNEDDVLEKGSFKAIFDEGYTWAGGISHRALYWLYDHYSGLGDTRRYFEMYNVFGDPSAGIWTDDPGSLVVDHAASLPIGSTSLSVSVTSGGSPVENALVCAARDADGVYATGYTNAVGVALLDLTPAPSSPGPMPVTVTKHDHYPYEGSTTIILTDSPYCVYQSHSVDDDGAGDSSGDADGTADAGETIELGVTLENIGTEPGYGVTATISEADPYVTVTDDTESYGDIPVSSAAACAEDYDFTIDSNCPDGHVVQFDLTATDGDSVWTGVFNVPVSAPVLGVADLVVDDSPGGNDCAEPGETVSLSVTLGNDGGDDAVSVSAALASSDSYVSVVQGAAGASLVPSGSSAQLVPDFEVTILSGAPAGHEVTLELIVTTAGGYSSGEYLTLVVNGINADMESTGDDWSHSIVTPGFNDGWHIETFRYHSTGHCWKFGGTDGGNYVDNSDGALETPPVCLGADGALSFWSWLDAEEESSTSAWDCALVEISTDDGSTWANLVPDGGYSHLKNYNTANPVPEGTPCWSGSFTWRQETFDLSAYEGERVTFRFRFASDASVTDEGWYVDDVSVTSTATGVGDDTGGEVPRFALYQNVPNPFNPVTTVRYSLAEPGRVAIRVYDVAGRLVRTLRDRREAAGERSVVWDGTNDAGRHVGSGVYFCSMIAGDFTDRRLMVLLK